jgi:hypothetical protein
LRDVGLYPRYKLGERNTLGLKFVHPLIGSNTPPGKYFTLTYGASVQTSPLPGNR